MTVKSHLLIGAVVFSGLVLALVAQHWTSSASASPLKPPARTPPVRSNSDNVACWVFDGPVSLPVLTRLAKSAYVKVDLPGWTAILESTPQIELPIEALEDYQDCRAFFVVSSLTGHGEPRAEGLLPNGRQAWLKLAYLSRQDPSLGERVFLGDCVWAPGNEWDGESIVLNRGWMDVTNQVVTVLPAPDRSPELREAVVVYQFDDARLGIGAFRVQPMEIP